MTLILDRVFNSKASYFIFNGQNIQICDHIEDVDKVVCFDFRKNNLSFSKFFYDIKILYRLMNFRFDSFNRLLEQKFSEEQIRKYKQLSDKIRYQIRSYEVCGIGPQLIDYKFCFPEGLMEDFYKEKLFLVQELYKDVDDDVKKFYDDFFFEKMKLLRFIEKNSIEINVDVLNSFNDRFSKLLSNSLVNNRLGLKFNSIGAKTGRLSFEKGTFDIYNCPTHIRECLVSEKDHKLFQFDYKSFQPRIAISLCDDVSFKNKFRNVMDVYSVFSGDRDKNKLSFLSWLYSSSDSSTFNAEAYPLRELRSKIINRARNSKALTNICCRPLSIIDDLDHVIFQNYITSVEVDIILSLLPKLFKLFQGMNSKILFPFHDSYVFSIHKDEMSLVEKIKDIMENGFVSTLDFTFPVEIKCGMDFKNMDKFF